MADTVVKDELGTGSEVVAEEQPAEDQTVAADSEPPATEEKEGKVFIGGLSWETTDETLQTFFGAYGPLKETVIMMDKMTGKPRGFGFAVFKKLSDAYKVLGPDGAPQKHSIDGRLVDAKLAVPREQLEAGQPAPAAAAQPVSKKVFAGGIS